MSTCLLVIGELGEVFRLDSPNELKKCVDLYNKRMSLEQNDIYLLDKNGRTIYFNAMHEVNYDSKIFIFNKTFYKERLIKIFEENIEKISAPYLSSSNLNFLPASITNHNSILEFHQNMFENNSLTNYSKLDKACFSFLELKKLSENLLENFENAKSIFKSVKVNVKICDKVRDNYNYQYNSLESIYKNISVLYEQCFNKYKELESDLGKMNEKNEKVLSIFKDSIEKLKTIELHARMQSAKEKYLIDIYFDESKMNVWKEKCVKSSDFITKKIKDKGELILAEKVKIRTEKNTNILNLKNDWNSIVGEYENIIHDKETLSVSILSSIFEDIKTFQKNILMLSESGSDEVIESLKTIKTKVATHKEIIQLLNQHNQSIEDFSKKMKSLLIKSSVQINVVFTNYHIVKKNLLEIMEKVEKYSEGLQTLDRDFSYLSNPSQFPQAYQASLTEIKRRLIFNRKIGKDIERLKQLVVKENINRKQFIQDYGKYLTHDYVPELKITDLKLSIEFNNQEEISNLPNILNEEEESALNSDNIYLDYDEFISQGQEAGNILMSKNNLPNVERSAQLNQLNQVNQVSIRKGSGDSTSMKKNSLPVNDYEDQIRLLNAKISELEIVNSIKENEIKKILQKLESRERKITLMQSEFEKLSQTFENLSENFLKQLSHKDNKLKEKALENENILKMINSQNNNKLDNCPMCRDIVTNSIDYQGWGNFVKDYHEKLHEKNKILSKFESRYQELVSQTSFIKKTFFTHLNSVIENKNLEIMSLKQTYENKLMTVEDFLSQERARHDRNEFENKNQVSTQSQNINLLETRLKDLGKLLNSYDVEIKNLKREKENLKKQIEEFKTKENNFLIEIKQKDSKLESIVNDYKSIEKQFDIQKKSINQLSEEIITKVKENTNLKFSLESKSKIIDELDKALENTKLNHIETLNEVHKANQSTIEKLNSKIDEMTQNAQEKLKNSEQYKNLSEEMSQLLNRKDEETKLLNENLNRIKKECEEYKTKYEKLFKLNESCEQETQILKKKVEEIQFSLTEKEKRIQEMTELTKFFSTNEPNFFSDHNKTNTGTNNEITSDQINCQNLTMAITNNINLNNLSKFLDLEEFVNVKRLEKGFRSIFVPHSPGVYVCINLNPLPMEATSNFDSNYEVNKFYRCNSILNIDSFDAELRELLMENSLIIIGKVSKLSDLYITADNNTYQLPEDSNYTLVDLEKVDYIIGFQGEEMIFRNYLF